MFIETLTVHPSCVVDDRVGFALPDGGVFAVPVRPAKMDAYQMLANIVADCLKVGLNPFHTFFTYIRVNGSSNLIGMSATTTPLGELYTGNEADDGDDQYVLSEDEEDVGPVNDLFGEIPDLTPSVTL